MKKIIVFWLILLVGCKTIYVPTPYPVRVVRDSIVTKIERDTMLVYPKQEQSVIAVDHSYLKTDLAESTASIDSTGLLHHSIQNFGLIPSKVTETKTNVRDSVPYPVEVIKETKVEVIKYKWGWFSWIGLLSCIGFIAFLVLKIKKFFT